MYENIPTSSITIALPEPKSITEFCGKPTIPDAPTLPGVEAPSPSYQLAAVPVDAV